MAVTADKPAPYAPAKTVLEIIDRHRERGLPRPIDGENLARAGVPESLLPRTLQALTTIDLIDDQGNPTPTFESLRLAPEAEFKKRLEDWIKSTYADVFAFVDPAKDGEERIRDAFRSYQPIGQQGRMVTLFTGLCVAAGLLPEKPPQPRANSNATVPKRVVSKPKVRPSTPPRGGGSISPGLPPALAGLLASLPVDSGGWTKAQRDKFLTTFEAVVDFVIPIKTDDDNGDDT